MAASNQKSSLLFTFLLFMFGTFGYIYPNPEPDTLKYFEHSFVQIITADKKNIYIDPYGHNQFKDSADIVLITHEHTDHNQINRVIQKKSCIVIRSANALKNGVYQSFTIGSVKITAIPAYNANHDKNACVGYVVEFDGIKLYHSGDTGKIQEMADLASQNITYALLPIDGIYTMTAEEATEAAAMIDAKYNIPIHTMPPPDTYSDANVARFSPSNKLVVRPGTAIELNSGLTSVNTINSIAGQFYLSQNYPNPFNPSTTISFQLPEAGNVSIKIFNIIGEQILELINQNMEAGKHSVNWNAEGLPSGTYLYRLESNNFTSTKKLLLLK